MFNHEPPDYKCPFCAFFGGHEDEFHTKQDIVAENEHALALVAPKWWVNNPGSLLVIPKQHYENIYDLPEDILGSVYSLTKRVAIAVRSTYAGCEGTSTRQHNEPAGNQAVWHLHVHAFPRYPDDHLYQNHDNKRFVSPEERLPYAEKLRAFLVNH